MASTPAALEASRVADAYGCMTLPNGDEHTVQGRDVELAYLQAKLKGPPVYAQFPEEL